MFYPSPLGIIMPNGADIWAADAPPSGNTSIAPWQAGDYLWITSPAAGIPAFYKCITAPSASNYDGVWQAIGATMLDGNGNILLGTETLAGPQQKVVTFDLQNNASLGTQTFFIADRAYTITGIKYVHKTAGTVTGAVASITKDTGTQAPGTGAALQTGTFDAKNTAANTVLSATLTATSANLTMAAGDRLAVLFGGTLTTLAGVTISVYMTPQGQSQTAVYFANVNADIATQSFLVAQRDMVVTGVKACYATAFVAAATLDVTKDTGTTAAGGGTSILAAAMAADGAVNTVITPALAATAATLALGTGDRLAVKFSATTTGVGVCVMVSFAPVSGEQAQTWQLALNAQQQIAQTFFVADRAYELVEAQQVHDVAAGGASKIAITIDKGTTAPGAGSAVQTDNSSAGFDLAATARTVQVATMAGRQLRLLAAGDRLGLKVAGAAQSTALVAITVTLVPR
jgi:hypothetical protein